ncbi:phage tail assembly protein T [Hydrocarboniphaga effusa]|uniref:phage tail assembly protein T n=1 Tax=Hydrocarboniphaga effusa TaxID=243629 RepID=UPI003F507C69
MTYGEFRGWCSYFEVHPFDDRSNFQIPSALTRALLANINRDSKVRCEPFTYKDFMPYDPPEEERVGTIEDVMKIFGRHRESSQ